MNTSLALNRNEYFFEHAPSVVAALANSAQGMSHYATPQAHAALTEHLARALAVSEHSITLCHGAEDGLLKILSWQRRFCEQLWVADFSWLNYLTIAVGLDYRVHTFGENIEADCLSTDLSVLNIALNAAAKPSMVLLASPNNPTGHVLVQKDFEKLLAAHPRHVFVLDGVYDTFQTPFAQLPQIFSNCIFVGSFSKYFGLPGLRIGYVVGKMPAGFSLSLGLQPVALDAAVAALQEVAHYTRNRLLMQNFAKEMEKWKSPFYQALASHAPFVLVKLKGNSENVSIPSEIFGRCESESGVCPKYFSRGQTHYLRWGLWPQNVNAQVKLYMQTLEQLLSQ